MEPVLRPLPPSFVGLVFADEEGTRKDNREWQTFTEEQLANTDSFIL